MSRHYYWLNANPKYWSVHHTPVGTAEDYTVYNDSGNKRFIFRCFTEAAVDDIVIAYQSNPNALILGVYKVTKAVENPDDPNAALFVTKIIDIPNAVTKKELVENGLGDIMPIRGSQGSLFPLEYDEYCGIIEVIEKKNPDLLPMGKNGMSLQRQLEKVSFEQAIQYSKKQGTYYLGRKIKEDKPLTKKEIKKLLNISKIDVLAYSKRDNTQVFFDLVDNNKFYWINKEKFEFILEVKDSDNMTPPFNLRWDFGIDRYIFVVYEQDNKEKYEFLGIAELDITEVEEGKKGKDPFAFAVHIEGTLLHDNSDEISNENLDEVYGYMNPKQVEQVVTTYYRSPEVADYAKKAAHGICQLCGKPAPFIDKNGEPYLESHHVIWLSRGGTDTTDNVVALCPNCHSKMHAIDDPLDIGTLLLAIEKRSKS